MVGYGIAAGSVALISVMLVVLNRPSLAELSAAVACSAGLVLLAVRLVRTERAARGGMLAPRALVEQAPNAVCVIDANRKITFLNQEAATLLRISQAASAGIAADVAVPLQPADPSGESWLDAALSGAVLHGRGELQFGDDRVPVSYTAGPVADGPSDAGAVLLFSASHDSALADMRRVMQDQYRVLVEQSPQGMILTDLYGFVVLANHQAAMLHGFETTEALAGRRMIELADPEKRSVLAGVMRHVLERGDRDACEYTALRNDGERIPVEAGIGRVSDGSRPEGLVFVIRDLTRQKQAEESAAIGRERALLQQVVAGILAQAATLADAIPYLLETLSTGGRWDGALFWQFDTDAQTLFAQYSWCRPDSGLGKYLAENAKTGFHAGMGLLGATATSRRSLWVEDVKSDIRYQRRALGGAQEVESAFMYPLVTADETQGVIEFVSRTRREYDAATVETIEMVSSVVSHFIKRKQAERALEHRALHDPLTELPNRSLFNMRLERALSVAATSKRALAMLVMDIDRFKEVNDTFGHLYGDALLRQAANRLQTSLRESDTLARLGGDEFAVILPSTTEDDAVAVAWKLVRTVEQPFPVESQILDVGISIGVALYPNHGQDPTTLLKHADVAMYQAKREKLGVVVYAADSDQHSPGRFALQGGLKRAIENGELSLLYQPKMDIRTRRVDCAEALVRWHHPTKGLVQPDDFIPVAEQTGLIRQLGTWVLTESLRQLAAWLEEGLDLSVAVNFSAQNLHDPQLLRTVGELLKEREIEPHRLVIEVTESSIMVNAERARETLIGLNRLGVRLSIDDFGTGYSSLSHLHHLPTQEIKIDKSFVLDMLDGGDGAYIAQSVIDLGHNFGLEVAAEGVENEETYALLQSMKVDQVQGFYLSPPMPGPHLGAWLREHNFAPELPKNILRIDRAQGASDSA